MAACQSPYSAVFQAYEPIVQIPDRTQSPIKQAPISPAYRATPTAIQTRNFPLESGQAIIGALGRVSNRAGETLPDHARHFGLGFNEITLANPRLDPWLPEDKQEILLPLQFILPEAPRKGIVLNLANTRIFFYPKNPNQVQTLPAGIGRDGWSTPLGKTRITAKHYKPTWVVPESILREHREKGDPLPKVIPPGPDNPLGDYALPLGFQSYLIHSTNKPYGVGMQVSHGCIRLYPEDAEKLFRQVEIGTQVNIVHQPYLAAWRDNMLYLEAHPPLAKWASQDASLREQIRNKLQALAAEKGGVVDWRRVAEILDRADGMPAPVLHGSADLRAMVSAAMRVEQPKQLYGQPRIPSLTQRDWGLLTPRLRSEKEAEKLAAMFNHQGPQIPARKIMQAGAYGVAAGPFKNKTQTGEAAKRIKIDFDLETTALMPQQ